MKYRRAKTFKEELTISTVPTGLFIMGLFATASIITLYPKNILFLLMVFGVSMIIYPFTKITCVVLRKER